MSAPESAPEISAASSSTALPASNSEVPDTAPPAKIERYSPSEEASLVAESDTLRKSANNLFTVSDFTGAITGYERALAQLPSYLDFEIAVLRSNITACFLQLKEWKSCIEQADKGLQCLEEYEKEEADSESKGQEDRIVEVADDEVVEEGIVEEVRARHTKDEVQKIRIKLLLRRAKARVETGGWAALNGAVEGMFLDIFQCRRHSLIEWV
jgi:hypothetical protein